MSGNRESPITLLKVQNWLHKWCTRWWTTGWKSNVCPTDWGTLFRGKSVTLLFLTWDCHLTANPQRLESRFQRPRHSHPPTCPMSIVPLSSDASSARNCPCTTAGQSPPSPDGHGHERQHGKEPTCAKAASACTSGRMTTQRAVRLWKRLPKEVMESTSQLITLEALSCKKVSTQSGNSSRIDVLTFLSVGQRIDGSTKQSK